MILITVNSLRADHLRLYGYGADTAPAIEKLAQSSYVFDAAIAQSNWTLPSQVSILTGTYAHDHGIYDRDRKMPSSTITLPAVLRSHGYKTAAFVGGLDMASAHGLSHGFDHYHDDTNGKPMGSFRDTVPGAIEWLSRHRNDNFFLYVQGYDAHPPFDKPAQFGTMFDTRYSGIMDTVVLDYALLKNIRNGTLSLNGRDIPLGPDDIGHILARYDGGIRHADQYIGELLKAVDDAGLSDRTIIILTAEHGEELHDHGTFDRFGGQILYDTVIRVPLIIRHPEPLRHTRRIARQVQLIDIMPTVLDLVRVPVPGTVHGSSMCPLMNTAARKGGYAGTYAFSEARPGKWSIRTQQWKLIYDDGTAELYDIQNDRSESRNRAREEPGIVYELLQEALAWRGRTRSRGTPRDTHLDLSDEMKKRLIDAGYW